MRKLATAAFAFCGAVFLSQYLLPTGQFFAAAACALLGSAAFFAFRRHRLRLLLILFGLAAGFCFDGLYRAFVFRPVTAVSGQTLPVVAVARERVEKTDYGGRVLITLDLPDAPKTKARLYLYGADVPDIQPGDTLSFTARLKAADTLYGEETDVFFSKGIFLTATPRGRVEITGASRSAAFVPARLAASISDTIGALFPREEAAFLRALLVGDARDLYGDKTLSEALRVTGTAHIVSVSGMHVAFLMNTLALLVRRRRHLPVVGFPVLLLFMALAGFRPAVVRAGIMQVFLLLAPAVRRENDPPTSLAVSLLVILLGNPFAARSVSLQLSFSATAGLLLFSGRLFEVFTRPARRVKNRLLRRVLGDLLSAPAASVAALSLSLPLTALHFGTVSLIAPLANLLILWAVSLAFSGAVLTLVLAFATSPIAALAFLPAAAAFLTALPCRFVLRAVRLLARAPLAAVYTSSPLITAWLAYLYLMALLCFLLREKKVRPLLPVSLSGSVLCMILLLTGLTRGVKGLRVTALDVGQGACAVFESGGAVAVVDCGGASGKDAGDILARYLSARGYDRIDLLILTHYHEDHTNGLETAFARLKVSALALPPPEKEDREAYENIQSLAFAAKADIIEVTRNVTVELGGASLRLYAPVGEDASNERGLAVLCSFGEFDALVTGDMGAGSEERLLELYVFPDIELLLVGHHGSKYSTSETLLRELAPEAAVISVGYNTYGHPAPEALERLRKEGVIVYRTDEDGPVTITVS